MEPPANESMSNEITKSISIDAPASEVFRALTDEKELTKWMAKGAKMEAKVGGEYELGFYSEARHAETTARGRVAEFVPDKKLAYTFVSSEDELGSPPSLVTWDLERSGGRKTVVTLVHSGFGGDPYRQILAWGYYLERLAAHCSKKPV